MTSDLDAIAAFVEAFETADRSPRERAAALDAAAAAMRSKSDADDADSTARSARALATALECLADLERWEADTVAAAVDAERYRRSAEHKARTTAAELDAGDPVCGPLRDALERIAATRDLSERRSLRDTVARTTVPLSLIDPQSTRGKLPSAGEPAESSAGPRAALIATIDGSPITWAHVVTRGVSMSSRSRRAFSHGRPMQRNSFCDSFRGGRPPLWT
jgi:hypothetical protein